MTRPRNAPTTWTGMLQNGLYTLRRTEARAPLGKRDRPLLNRVSDALEYLRARARRKENLRGT